MENYKLHFTVFANFIEIQKTSFCWFISEGLNEELNKFSYAFNSKKKKILNIIENDYKLKSPIYNDYICKEKELTYSSRIYINVKLENRQLKKLNLNITNKRLFIGTLPLMTDKATFIVNGCERVIISQIVRNSGIYFQKIDHKIKNKYIGILISKNGFWLNFELKSNLINQKKIDEIYITTDKINKIKATDFLNQMLFFENLSVESPNSTLNNDFNVNRDIYLDILNRGFLNIGKSGRLQINKSLNTYLNLDVEKITSMDLILILDYLIKVNNSESFEDDIDHLKYKKIKSVGELIQFQFSLGLLRMKSKIASYFNINRFLEALINPKPLETVIKQFFGSSQLSQFMDQTNPLSSLTHKRRISSLGLGGLDRDKVNLAVRDIHPSHYNRLCPIETPEGQNAGVIASLTTCSRINSLGFIETPFWPVKKGQIIKTEIPIYLTADIEDNFYIASGDTAVNKIGFIVEKNITVRYKQEFITVSYLDVDFIGVSPVQIVSPGAALIPFFEHNDANRALMGSNMQRQSVPLLISQKPLIGTGLEHQIAMDSGMIITSINDGIVKYVSSKKIIITEKFNNVIYNLEKFVKSNQNTCINYRPTVWLNQTVRSGEVIADTFSAKNGELSLGVNVTVAYMPWEGYNYEDAVLINERLVYEDIFSSIHIETFEIEVEDTIYGPEETTYDLPSISENDKKNLNSNGIIKKGSFAKSNDILVGKVRPKDLANEIPEMKLLKAIFGKDICDVMETSFHLPDNVFGRITDVKTFLSPDYGIYSGIIKTIKISIAQIRKIQVGDKIAGRHGNKGIVSKILPRQDMPYLPDGSTVDLILNPLGVPSRMNVGQLYECLLGFAAYKLNKRFKILPFDEMYGLDSSRILTIIKLKEASLKNNQGWLFNPYSPGKVVLIDGRVNEFFKNPITVGKSYMLKLIHLVDDKIHARSTGPYSLLTQQPLGGKARQGGQRFGEMEVWALEAYGAAYTLVELLTLKSDDINGRDNLFESIIYKTNLPYPKVPESFKLLMFELQSVGLEIKANCTIF
jgi:DNA-directed RNA polymerase subunit beta